MTFILSGIGMMILVMLSNVISHFLRSVPLPLIQVGMGIIVAMAIRVEINLPAGVLLLVFVAPLLFNEGQHFPRTELKILRVPIVIYSILLVFVTTLVGGFLIHYLVPQLPLAVAIALASILAPTDHIAVSEYLELLPLPRGIKHLVQGESLINEVSGLTAFKYAILAIVTGTFSLQAAAGGFIYVLVAGGVIGAIVMYIIDYFEIKIIERGITDAILFTGIQLVTPFIVYYITEHVFHASGGIAVVTAALISRQQQAEIRSLLPEMVIAREKTWDLLIYFLTGTIFIILGNEFPIVFREQEHESVTFLMQGLFAIVMVWLLILAIRVIWVFADMLFAKLRQPDGDHVVSLRLAFLTGIIGVRGAVNMASVLSIPFVLDDGTIFPQRSFVLFIAAGVIAISLIVPAILLPFINRKQLTFEELQASKEKLQLHKKEYEVRRQGIRCAVQQLEKERTEENREVVSDLIHEYHSLLSKLKREMSGKSGSYNDNSEKDAIHFAMNTERNVVLAAQEREDLSGMIVKYLLTSINRREKLLLSHNRFRTGRVYRTFKDVSRNLSLRRQERSQAGGISLPDLEVSCTHETIRRLTKELQGSTREDGYKNMLLYLIGEHKNRIERLRHMTELDSATYYQQLYKLQLHALAAERSYLQNLYETGEISRELALKIRKYISYSEITVMAMIDRE